MTQTPPIQSSPVLRPHRGGAVLALGICSLAFGLGCGGVGLVLGIIAWVMGKNDLAAIDAGLMDPSGRGLCQAGMICGIIGTILGALGTLALIAYAIVVLGFIAAAGAAGAAAGNNPFIMP